MKLLLLLSFLYLAYPTNFKSKNDFKIDKIELEDVKFCLIFTIDNEESKNLIIDPIFDEDISSRFTYQFTLNSKKETEDGITEIYYEDILLGKIYGRPTKQFLLKILPTLENQVKPIIEKKE